MSHPRDISQHLDYLFLYLILHEGLLRVQVIRGSIYCLEARIPGLCVAVEPQSASWARVVKVEKASLTLS